MNFIHFAFVHLSSMKRLVMFKSDRFGLGHFNGTVSTPKHLKELPGAGSVVKKGHVLGRSEFCR